MFEKLKDRCRHNLSLSEAEKDFVLYGLRQGLSSESIYEWPVLQSALFKHLTLIYYSGSYHLGEKYFKPLSGKIVQIPFVEAERDLKFLLEHSTSIIEEIQKKRDSRKAVSDDEMELLSEFRYNRRQLITSDEYKNDIIFRSSFRCKHELAVIRIGVLYSYYKLLEHKEDWPPMPIDTDLTNLTYRLTFGRLLHVINRHFSPTMKFKTDKSFFKSDYIVPGNLPLLLTDSVRTLDEMVPFSEHSKYIHFCKDEKYYTVVLNYDHPFLTLGTAHPEYREHQIQRFHEEYEPIKTASFVFFLKHRG